MLGDPLLAALDDALKCPQVAHLSRADRLALALWWLIERVANEFEMLPERAADEVAILIEVAEEMGNRSNIPTLRQSKSPSASLKSLASSYKV